MLECQDLTPVAQGILRQQPHFRQAVENHPARFQFIDQPHDIVDGLAEFNFGRMENRLLEIGIEIFFINQFIQCQTFQRPAMRRRYRPQLGCGFRQGDVETGFAIGQPGQQELQAAGRLAGTGSAFQQVQTMFGQTAAQNRIETGNAGRAALGGSRGGGGLSHVGGRDGHGGILVLYEDPNLAAALFRLVSELLKVL